MTATALLEVVGLALAAPAAAVVLMFWREP